MNPAKIEKLVRMANQIGDAFITMPEQEAIAGAATHLRLYWTPKMIREIVDFAGSEPAGLNAIAAGAVAALKNEHVG